MRKFTLPISILLGFTLSTAGWLSFEAGRRVQLSKVVMPTTQSMAQTIESVRVDVSPQSEEAESDNYGPDFEDLDRQASKSSFTKYDLTYKPILQKPERYWPTNGLKIDRGRRNLLHIKADEELGGTWLTFPLASAKPNKRSGSRFFRGNEDVRGKSAVRLEDPFPDIDGDNVKNVIVSTYTGGMHCCYGYDIYSLGKRSKRYDHIDGAHSTFEFVDVNNDRKIEAIGYDWTFAYWETCFAASPAPLVILRPTERGYKLSAPLMKLRPPSESELKALVDDCVLDVKKDCEQSQVDATSIPVPIAVRPAVWSTMLDLIYSGNSKFAWKFLDMYWPGCGNSSFGFDGACDLSKTQFKKDFLDQLSGSPYWKELKALNRDDPVLRSHK